MIKVHFKDIKIIHMWVDILRCKWRRKRQQVFFSLTTRSFDHFNEIFSSSTIFPTIHLVFNQPIITFFTQSFFLLKRNCNVLMQSVKFNSLVLLTTIPQNFCKKVSNVKSFIQDEYFGYKETFKLIENEKYKKIIKIKSAFFTFCLQFI